ncbi:MAG: pseudouridine synthase [Lachnospiraceae bacterium]|nr:pseudouridine synthase [Lachnospiraceae bacterium]
MEMRLNKYLSDAGVCSRREADRLVEEGRITIDGKVAVMGQKVLEGQKVAVDGKSVAVQEKKVILAVNKPMGVVCTTSDKDRAQNIVELLQYPLRIYPVGRLDKDSEGLLLMTNDGALMDEVLRARNGHEKEYIVEIDKTVTDEFVQGMAAGVPILDTVTRPCQVEKIGRNRFRIILTQGLNRQIRRMCEYFGCRVVSLKRVRIVNIRLGNLPLGGYRELTKAEEQELRRQLDPGAQGKNTASDKKKEKSKKPYTLNADRQKSGAKKYGAPKRSISNDGANRPNRKTTNS